MSNVRAALALLLVLAGSSLRADDTPSATYALHPGVPEFIRDLVERHAFDESELRAVFSRARREDAVLSAMRAQPERQSRSWGEYRAMFVNGRHLRAGLAFWKDHAAQLARARRTYGVPEEIVVAILGVETFYGRNTGRWRVIDALATLAFDYPPRAPFFRSELENYLLFAREMELDVFALKGSYAGAIGIPQFMPGSYLHYAVDFDGDGVIDLQDNASDAIGSVANYLRRHGWRPGEAVQRSAHVSGEAFRPYADGNPLPQHTLGELARAGVKARGAPLPAEARAALLQLETPRQRDDFRVGLQNFYVLTLYNSSVFYALAVADLADALRAARGRKSAAPK